MRLIDLYRRRHLAYELLDEYDGGNIDVDEALRRIRLYGAAHLHPVNAGPTWAEQVRDRLKDWPA